MTCEVEHLRMTDGHGWVHKGDSSDREYHEEKPKEKQPLLQIKLLGQIAYECYMQYLSFDKVCMVLNISDRTARNRVGQWAKKHDLAVPRSIAPHKPKQSESSAILAKKVYDEYMTGVTSLSLAVKYNKSEKLVKGIISRYRKKHNLPQKRIYKKRLQK